MHFFYLVVALLFCLTVHEAAHAWVAYKLGDPTAKALGRVSLNPLRHLDLIGTLMIFLVQFGWGKPVPYDERNLKHPRRDAALIAIAGPLSNLITALIIALFLKYNSFNLPVLVSGSLAAIYSLSIVLFLFNLLPIAPLDGSKVIGVLIPRKYDDQYAQFLDKGPFMLVMLIIFDRLIATIINLSPLSVVIGYGYDLVTTLIFFAT